MKVRPPRACNWNHHIMPSSCNDFFSLAASLQPGNFGDGLHRLHTAPLHRITACMEFAQVSTVHWQVVCGMSVAELLATPWTRRPLPRTGTMPDTARVLPLHVLQASL